MSCDKVQEQISLSLDGQLTPGEWEHSRAHIETCRRCDAHMEMMQSMHTGLRRMATPQVPAAVTARLRVTASHERARRLARISVAAMAGAWRSNMRLAFDNMMRPFAVPVTGGLFSAILLFSILVPRLTFVRSTSYEPPIGALADAPAIFVAGPEGEIVGAGPAVRLERGNATISGNELSLVLLIDEHGAVQQWELSGGDLGERLELTREMKNLILLSRFNPATISGQPTWGLTQVVFPRARRTRS